MNGARDLERRAWVALAGVDGVSDRLMARFLGRFGSATDTLAVAADRDVSRGLARIIDAAPRSLSLVVAGRIRAAAVDPDAIEGRLAELGAWALTPLDVGYPVRLRELDPPPVAIFGMGDPGVLRDERSVAVVGTRHPTPGGRALAGRIARRLAEAGAVVVSGLAVGIDGAAHAATLDAGGRTAAIIGGGLDVAGPRAHDRLRGRIVATGGVVAGEHAPGIAPTRGTFPRRNRIISVLTRATVVVEAPDRSGALITARHALEQGRVVLAVPGRPDAFASAGCLALLHETPARPWVGLEEMVHDLGLDDPGPRAGPGPVDRTTLRLDQALGQLGPVERAVAVRLARGPASNDALSAATGLAPAIVAGALTLLQVRGWTHPIGVVHLPAGPLLGGDASAEPSNASIAGVVR